MQERKKYYRVLFKEIFIVHYNSTLYNTTYLLKNYVFRYHLVLALIERLAYNIGNILFIDHYHILESRSETSTIAMVNVKMDLIISKLVSYADQLLLSQQAISMSIARDSWL